MRKVKKPIKPQRGVLSGQVEMGYYYTACNTVQWLLDQLPDGCDLSKATIRIDRGYYEGDEAIVCNYQCPEPEKSYQKKLDKYKQQLRKYEDYVKKTNSDTH